MKFNEQQLTPENYARLLKEAQDKLGIEAGSAALHQHAINQGFSMNGNAVVAGVKWVHGEIQSDDSVLVQGLHAADPFAITEFKTA
jgi:hypothetical protein